MKMVKYCYCMQAKIKHTHSFYLGIDDFAPLPKFLYTKLHGPSDRIFVGSTALKALLKTLVYVVFTFIICQNTHSTNTTCAFNPLLQVCKRFGESVFITLVVTSSGDLSHREKFTDISTFPWLGPSNFV